jgi:cellulose synthase/poly-beta-1,6-N-acetylglucosamine synthase-like glycosyltransferase
LARHELLLCIDADALLNPQALAWMVRHLEANPRIGAVTGNPRIRNRTSLLGRLQVGEFSMIIGLIKRAQSMLGGLFASLGSLVCFGAAPSAAWTSGAAIASPKTLISPGNCNGQAGRWSTSPTP